VLGLVAAGADPAAQRVSEKKAGSVAQLCDTFLAEHVEAKRKARTAVEYRRLIQHFIQPALGTFKVADVTRAHVNRLHHSLRGTPYQANRVLAVCSAMLAKGGSVGIAAGRLEPVPARREVPGSRARADVVG
jgi:hypothetical protein